MKEIVIPEGVTYIPSSCFNGCSSLQKITVKGTINAVYEYAFSGCSALTSFDFSKLTKMGSYAFSGTALTSVTVSAAITEIPYGAFSGCEKLTTVKLHSGVTMIVDSAF